MNDFWDNFKNLIGNTEYDNRYGSFFSNDMNGAMNPNNMGSIDINGTANLANQLNFGNNNGFGFNPSTGIDAAGTADLANKIGLGQQDPGIFSMDAMFGGGKGPGWLNGGVSVLNGLGNTWLGMQQYGLAKDSFNFNKQMASKNYENQALASNNALAASLRRNAGHRGMSKEEAVTQGMDRWGADEQVGVA